MTAAAKVPNDCGSAILVSSNRSGNESHEKHYQALEFSLLFENDKIWRFYWPDLKIIFAWIKLSIPEDSEELLEIVKER